jgi:Ras-related GTP-binding protein A/B
MARKKVLLMGKAMSGKTSMRSIIFANYLARDTMRLSPTLDVEHHHVRFLGDLVLNLWDCGGQDAFYESYFERDRETIFRSVELLIYVFDIASDCPDKDFDHFIGVLEAIEENSPDARIFVLVHKMDLVAQEEQETILEDRKRLIEESCASCGVSNFNCFGTSIWDETLYKAWSEIVTNLIPNIGVLKSHLDDFCRICNADEVVLFERATFLVISHSHGNKYKDEEENSNYNQNGIRETYNDDVTDNHHVELEEDQADGNNSIGASSDPEAMPSSIDGTTDNALPSVYSEVTGIDETMESGTVGINVGEGNGTIGSGGTGLQQQQQKQITGHATRNRANSDMSKKRIAPHFDTHRFEKISNIVKQFKLSCEKAQSQFQGMEVSNSKFTAFIDAFTANTYIMVIVSDPNVHTSTTLMNIKNARRHFERFIPRS